MKKIKLFSVFIAIFIFSSVVSAQGDDFKKFGVQAGYGIWSYDGIMIKVSHRVNNFSQSFLQYYDLPMDSFKRYGDVSFAFKYRPIRRLQVGVSFVWTGTKTDVFNCSSIEDVEPLKMGELRYNYFTPAADVTFFYVAKTFFKCYGNIGLGCTFGLIQYKSVSYMSDEETPNKIANKMIPHFNYQFTPIGFRFGNNVGAFVEFGFGYRGVINGGLFVNF